MLSNHLPLSSLAQSDNGQGTPTVTAFNPNNLGTPPPPLALSGLMNPHITSNVSTGTPPLFRTNSGPNASNNGLFIPSNMNPQPQFRSSLPGAVDIRLSNVERVHQTAQFHHHQQQQQQLHIHQQGVQTSNNTIFSSANSHSSLNQSQISNPLHRHTPQGTPTTNASTIVFPHLPLNTLSNQNVSNQNALQSTHPQTSLRTNIFMHSGNSTPTATNPGAIRNPVNTTLTTTNIATNNSSTSITHGVNKIMIPSRTPTAGSGTTSLPVLTTAMSGNPTFLTTSHGTPQQHVTQHLSSQTLATSPQIHQMTPHALNNSSNPNNLSSTVAVSVLPNLLPGSFGIQSPQSATGSQLHSQNSSASNSAHTTPSLAPHTHTTTINPHLNFQFLSGQLQTAGAAVVPNPTVNINQNNHIAPHVGVASHLTGHNVPPQHAQLASSQHYSLQQHSQPSTPTTTYQPLPVLQQQGSEHSTRRVTRRSAAAAQAEQHQQPVTYIANGSGAAKPAPPMPQRPAARRSTRNKDEKHVEAEILNHAIQEELAAQNQYNNHDEYTDDVADEEDDDEEETVGRGKARGRRAGGSGEDRQRLKLNRKAELAREARKKKKNYVMNLEQTNAQQQNQLQTLRQQQTDAQQTINQLRAQVNYLQQQQNSAPKVASGNRNPLQSHQIPPPSTLTQHEIDELTQEQKLLEMTRLTAKYHELHDVQQKVMDTYLKHRVKEVSSLLAVYNLNGDFGNKTDDVKRITDISIQTGAAYDSIGKELITLATQNILTPQSRFALWGMTHKNVLHNGMPPPEASDAANTDSTNSLWDVLVHTELQLVPQQLQQFNALYPTFHSVLEQFMAIEQSLKSARLLMTNFHDNLQTALGTFLKILSPAQTLKFYEYISRHAWLLKMVDVTQNVQSSHVQSTQQQPFSLTNHYVANGHSTITQLEDEMSDAEPTNPAPVTRARGRPKKQ